MTEKTTRPASLTVTLSDGSKVTIKPITWEGWRLVKERILAALSASEVSRALSSLLNLAKTMDISALSQSDDAKAVGLTILDGLADGDFAEVVPGAVRMLNAALDDMTADLIEHSIDGPQPERVSAPDVIEIRKAVFQVTDFAGLLNAEKNSLVALARDVAGAINSKN